MVEISIFYVLYLIIRALHVLKLCLCLYDAVYLQSMINGFYLDLNVYKLFELYSIENLKYLSLANKFVRSKRNEVQ